MTKQCKFCTKPFSFYKGHRLYCSTKCLKARNSQYNKKQYHDKYKLKPEFLRKRHNYYVQNKDKVLAASRAWYKKNKKRRNTIERRWRLKQYGLSIEQYNALVKKQRCRCGICNTKMNKPNVDHSHKTTKVRGLLCGPCNKGLGCFYDSPKRLQQAIAYLEQEPRCSV